jgi:hypothetical protein
VHSASPDASSKRSVARTFKLAFLGLYFRRHVATAGDLCKVRTMIVRLHITVAILLAYLNIAIRADGGTVNITSEPNYSLQRICATACFFEVIDAYTGAVLAMSLGCDLSPIENACFCRTDLIPSAVSDLSSCISTGGCSNNPNDFSTAASIYLAYCSSNGYVTASTTPTLTNSVSPSPAAGNSLLLTVLLSNTQT